jgi:hypothetical protein
MSNTRKVIVTDKQTNKADVYSCLGLYCKHIGISRRTVEKWFLPDLRQVEYNNMLITKADNYYHMGKKK